MTEPKESRVVENDALVVLALRSLNDSMSHHAFKVRAAALGFALSKSQCHNMLHRATGRVMCYPDGLWRITMRGWTYREHVLDTIRRLLSVSC
jgi:hypothetical protein